MKMILFLQNNDVNLRKYNHNIIKLADDINIQFSKGTVEDRLLVFLNDFALKDRYKIPDLLSSNDNRTENEPIKKFYNTVCIEILKKHNLKSLSKLPDNLINVIHMVHIDENFNINQDELDILNISQEREHLAKFATMYVGRLLQPFIRLVDDLSAKDEDTPYLYEHFVYIKGKDSYFKNRKTFIRK
jgi:hypothetical protein